MDGGGGVGWALEQGRIFVICIQFQILATAAPPGGCRVGWCLEMESRTQEGKVSN